MVHKRRRGTAIVHTPNGILVVSEEGRTYHLPGGVARKGESRRKAAIRELREETGLTATDCSYLFEYTSFSNYHKVFLIKCKGTAEPKNEIKHLAYFDGSNVDVSDTARKIIERYCEIKNSKFEYVKLPPSHTAEEGEKSMSKRCEVCGKEENLPFVCNYCNKTFCVDHRLPENHDCTSKPRTPPPYTKVGRGVYVSKEVLQELERAKEQEELEERERFDKVREMNRKKKILRRVRNFALFGLIFVIGYFLMAVYYAPPSITIISPETRTYSSDTVDLTYAINKPAYLMSYSLDGQASIIIAGNTTLTGLSEGLHNLTIYASNIINTVPSDTVYFTVDTLHPVIKIISPKTETYDIVSIPCSISLTYTINEPTSWVGYSLNDAESATLTSNTTLDLLPGRYNLAISANDTAGNIGFSRVSFTVTRIFSSLDELINFLREDDLSDVEWTINHTCDAFAKNFIKIAEEKGYYIFTYYALEGTDLDKYNSAVESIKIVKKYSWGTETRWYVVGTGLGHAVVRTTIGDMDVIVDPQTDIILAMKDFTVLYEGEITQD